MLKNKKHQGFTLIELLVVIAIIGILASIVLVSLGGARSKARDARRQSDIRQISLALEMDYDDDQAYATSTGSTVPTPIGAYLDPVPEDPQTGGYIWLPNDSSPTACPDMGQWYCCYAVLETDPVTYFAASHKGTRDVGESAPSTTGSCCW